MVCRSISVDLPVAQLVKNQPAMQETWVWSWVGKIPWRRERLPIPVFWLEEFHGQYSPSEKAMAPHSNTLAWKIPWAEEPGRLQSMGSWRVGQDWTTSLSLFTFMHWRRKWQPTPVFLPGESQGWWSVMGCHLWGHTDLDMTEVTKQQQQYSP